MEDHFLSIVKRVKDVVIGDTVLITDELMAEVTGISTIPHLLGRSRRYFTAKVDSEHYREYLRFDDDWIAVIVIPEEGVKLSDPE